MRSFHFALGVLFASSFGLGCSAAKDTGDDGLNGDPDGGSFDIGGGGDGDNPFDVKDKDGAPCTGLACQVKDCGSSPTSLSGTVYAPNGTLPLYNVIVYVPNSEVKAFPDGVQCDKCGSLASGNPITTTLSDYKGHFKLDNVPVGTNIPLVIQLGKWRRQITIPTVKECTDNPITDKNLTRLPKKRSEGDMPKIAVTTGGCDKLSACCRRSASTRASSA